MLLTMQGIDNLWLFVAAGWLLNLTPGPDVLFIVTHAMRDGARAGVIAALGITAGCFVHILAAAAGVSALVAGHLTDRWVGSRGRVMFPALALLVVPSFNTNRTTRLVVLGVSGAVLAYPRFFDRMVHPQRYPALDLALDVFEAPAPRPHQHKPGPGQKRAPDLERRGVEGQRRDLQYGIARRPRRIRLTLAEVRHPLVQRRHAFWRSG